jgi:signal peptidase I
VSPGAGDRWLASFQLEITSRAVHDRLIGIMPGRSVRRTGLRSPTQVGLPVSVESKPVRTTSLLFLVFGVMWLFELLFAAWLLRLGARWAGVARISYKRAVLAVILMGVADQFVRVLVLYGFENIWPEPAGPYIFVPPIAALVMSLVAMWWVVQTMLNTTLGKAILAWLPTLLAWSATLGLALGVVRPYLFEAFSIPTNAMAPTILGRHGLGTCPSCGGPAYFSAASPGARSPREELGICGRCRRASTITVTGESVFSGDRIIAAKFIYPRRWDLIVFRSPDEPSTQYVERLVGLPGERVAIQDGEIWINGSLVPKPAEISGLVYVADLVREEVTSWGPVSLGPGEYLVLGDFSPRAKDSRYWVTGAPGHPPYAVPASYITGVVTQTYWPLPRWRIFR